MSKLTVLLMFFLFQTTLKADDLKSCSLFYTKIGATHTPETFLPTFGLGARWQRDDYGLDLSANLSTIIFSTYASAKGMFLFYPKPEEKNQLYLGVGPGIAYFEDAGLPAYGGCSSGKKVNVEGVLGYEFRHFSHLKTFVQFELSQPAYCFNQGSYKPTLSFTVGIGF